MKKEKILLTSLFVVTLTGFVALSSFIYPFSGEKMTFNMQNQKVKYGIEGKQAPELSSDIYWVDGEGKQREAVKLAEHKGKFKVIYCFQSWCPGCHSQGLPSLQKMVSALQGNDKVEFFAIQTVFEGRRTNTRAKAVEVQKQYDLHIPFGHDPGNSDTRNVSTVMRSYRTGGTPWFIFIDQNDEVVFNDYHLDTEKTIEFLKKIE